eukprot:TRINITY_DN1536_c0_g1_i1.p1 TRINITY_DN1536_c0_g1~~TRINITY_DN1536_c0_g1_i1.p1  ORF type:complete len:424 (-),score=83.98 TRINITY_DN1536_c0_g1_i1:67-1338(-)
MVVENDDVFGDGGAFPEIHVTQYPLGMGKKITANTLARNAVVPNQKQSWEPQDLAKPTDEEALELMARTAELLSEDKGKKSTKEGEPTYIRYTPRQGLIQNTGAKSRVIRMVEAPVDPLEPPKFKFKKTPDGPPSPPAPVMHSPPRKLTVKDQADWKVPPCISNWKNPKGYTIPLHQRLAADGRALQEVTINDRFAQLAEALYTAERAAREEVESRTKISRQLQARQRAKKEEELRKIALQTREERSRNPAGTPLDSSWPTPQMSVDEDALRQREELREEKRREIEREQRLAARKKTTKERERDVSEKIALGQSAGSSADSLYDSRLFNQAAGISSGYEKADETAVFDKALFHGGSSANYRPDKDRIAAEQDRANKIDRIGRSLEFERDDDPFGLSQILSTSKTAGNKGAMRGSEPDKKRSKG